MEPGHVAASELVPGVVSSLATTSVPVARPGQPAGEVRRSLVGQLFDDATHVVVLDGERFVGAVPIESLLAADDDRAVEELVDPGHPAVPAEASQEVAAWRAGHPGSDAVIVVNGDQQFVGFVPAQRLLRVLVREHDEDMARLGGFLAGSEQARRASQESIGRRFVHRMPWLLVGLAGALAAAAIVGSFEASLEANVTIAFFLPGIVYLADAVGTQTEALVIRGLSVGVGVGRILAREIATGLLVGTALALAFFPIGVLGWGEADVAIAVSLSLMIACSLATAIALALPWAFHRVGLDPAFGSGPLATVIQDVLSIVVYLMIADAIVS